MDKKIRFATAENNSTLSEFASVKKTYFGYYDFREYPHNNAPIRADYFEYHNLDWISLGRASTAAQQCASLFLFNTKQEIRLVKTAYSELFILSKAQTRQTQRFGFTHDKILEVGTSIKYTELYLSFPTLFTKVKHKSENVEVIKDSVNLFGNIWAIISTNSKDYILIQTV